MNVKGGFDPERVLVYRLGSLGDTLLALPAFHLIRHRFPRAKVTLLTHVPTGTKAAALVSILEHTELYHDVISYPLRLRSFGQLRVLWNEIALRRFDVAIHLAEDRGRRKSLRDYLFFRACGISRVFGLPWHNHYPPARLPDGWSEWEAKRLVRRLASLGSVNLKEERWWDLRLTANEHRAADELLATLQSPFIAASLGTKVEVNHWTETNWCSLLELVHKRWPGLGLVMLGARDEFASCERCLRGWFAPKLNLCGLVPPRVSAAILRQACLFLGHDSGPLHLAATVGTPCVGIFSARNRPGQWFPRGKQSVVIYHRTPCFGCGLEICSEHKKKCILSITVEEVLGAVENQLSASRPDSPITREIPELLTAG
jgi:heptosyltransferase-3